jgi:diguanylate cyclase (GGDEF)-like protein
VATVLAACLASPAVAALQDSGERLVRVEPVARATFAASSVDEGALHVPGGGTSRARLRFELPRGDDVAGQWVLRFDRDSLTRIGVRAAGWPGATRRFFAPAEPQALFPSSFDFPLPPDWDGSRTVELEVDATGPYSLQPRLVRGAAAMALEQRAIALYGALYACLALLVLIAASLLTATRDRAYLALLVFLGCTMLLLGAVNGHLYAVGWLGWFGLWDAYGIWALILAAAAAGLWLAQLYAQTARHAPRLHRVLGGMTVAMLLIAAACLLRPPGADAVLKAVATLGWVASAIASLAAIGIAVRRGIWMSLPLFVVLLLLVLAGMAYEAMLRGWLPGGFWSRHAYQVVMVATGVTLAIGLIGRITEFRAARDRDRLARDDSERRLERESARADLIQTLQDKLRDLPPGDMEWAAFRALFDQLVPTLRLESGALIAYGFHGFDLLLAEPLKSKDHFAALLSNRIGMMKGLARTRAPLQLPLEDAEPPGGSAATPGAWAASPGAGRGGSRHLHAVVPLPIRAPGWGVLLLERSADEAFSHDELMLASELGRLTIQHADEAATALNLRRSAELDALTGALNRRTIDLWLARSFTESHRNGQPLAVLFVDIDHFKSINDTYGHACGDACLRRVSEALRRELEPGDLLGRYGGEEFIVVLPGRNGDAARQLGERMRAAVEREDIEHEGRPVRLTASIGVATRLDREDAPSATVERADKALYAAKRGGRNRVNVAPAVFN